MSKRALAGKRERRMSYDRALRGLRETQRKLREAVSRDGFPSLAKASARYQSIAPTE